MKKRKLIKGMMAVAIVAVAGLTIYTNQPKEEMTDVMLANIEALATGESIGSKDCYKSYVEAPGDNSLAVWLRVCSTCTQKWLTYANNKSNC